MPNEIVIDEDGKSQVALDIVIEPEQPVLPNKVAPGLDGQDDTPGTSKVKMTPKRNPDDKDEGERVAALYRRFVDARNTRTASGIEDEWAEAERLYNQEDGGTPDESDWRSDAFVPHATREVNNAVPHMISAVLDADRLVTLTADDANKQDFADLEETVVSYQMTQKMKFPQALEIVCKQAAILGTGVVFMGFKMERQEKIRMVPKEVAQGITAMRPEKENYIVDAYNTVTPLDITDVWVDPMATPTHLGRLYYYERKSKRQIRDQGLPYKNLDLLEDYPPSMPQFLNTNEFMAYDSVAIGSRNRDTTQEQNNVGPDDRLHHLIHEWDLEKKTWTILADINVELLAPRPWPTSKFPFVFVRYDFAPANRFYGRGVVAPISKSCRNANRLRRQRDDNVELCLNRMMMVRMGAVMDEQEEFVWRPGGVIHVRGGTLDNAVKVIEIGDVTPSAYQDERIIKQDIEDVNGIGNIAAGVPDSKSRTATGTSILRQMAVLRLRGPIRHVMAAVQEMVEIMLANNKKYIKRLNNEHLLGPIAKLYKLYTEKFDDDASATLNIHPASLYDNSDVVNAQIMNAVNVAGSLGLSQELDPRKLVRFLFKRVAGLKDTDTLFRDEDASYTASDFMAIMNESQAILSGAQIMPQSTDRHQAHIDLHQKAQALAPDKAQLLDPHVAMHQQMMQSAIAASAMPAGAGNGNSGPGGGGGAPERDLPQLSGAQSGAAGAGNTGAPTTPTEVGRA